MTDTNRMDNPVCPVSLGEATLPISSAPNSSTWSATPPRTWATAQAPTTASVRPWAKRELYWGFKAFIDNVEDFRLAPGRNNLRHYPNYALRALNELHIEFTAKAGRGRNPL